MGCERQRGGPVRWTSPEHGVTHWDPLGGRIAAAVIRVALQRLPVDRQCACQLATNACYISMVDMALQRLTEQSAPSTQPAGQPTQDGLDTAVARLRGVSNAVAWMPFQILARNAYEAGLRGPVGDARL